MADENRALLDLLGPLFDGMFETPLWRTFLDRFRAAVRADYASLIFRPPAPRRPSLVHLWSGEAASRLIETLYRESLHERDPVPYHALAEGRVYALDEFYRAGDPEHDAYRAAMHGPAAARIVRLAEPGGVSVWLSTTRHTGDFAATDTALIAALAPHLRRALRTYVALERERFSGAVSSEAIRRLSFGWITLDAAGRVLASDADCARVPGGSPLRLATGRRLRAGDPALDREIAEAVRALADEPPGRPRAIVLSRDPWLDMLLVPAARRPPSPPGPPPAVIAYVHSDDWSSADRCGQLADLFKLLPSEARLALALGRGLSIAEAAADIGVTVETARTYSKKIYAKTGARGHPDLVRFIHRSVLAIG